MKLQALFLGLALAVSGAAFARDVTVVRHGDGDVTKVVRRDDGSVKRVVRRHGDVRRVIVNPGHHHGWNHARRVVIVHPAHHRHHHYVTRRTVVVRHNG
jgi:hypothetical protein